MLFFFVYIGALVYACEKLMECKDHLIETKDSLKVQWLHDPFLMIEFEFGVFTGTSIGLAIYLFMKVFLNQCTGKGKPAMNFTAPGVALNHDALTRLYYNAQLFSCLVSNTLISAFLLGYLGKWSYYVYWDADKSHRFPTIVMFWAQVVQAIQIIILFRFSLKETIDKDGKT